MDAGALIAFERNERAVVALMARAHERGLSVAVPAGVVAQTWRDGRRQVRLARLLASPVTEIVALDDRAARAVGQLCGVAGVTDIVDVSVVWCAVERGHRVVTSDPDDLRGIDPRVGIVAV